jgi:hypothetical protein
MRAIGRYNTTNLPPDEKPAEAAKPVARMFHVKRFGGWHESEGQMFHVKRWATSAAYGKLVKLWYVG